MKSQTQNPYKDSLLAVGLFVADGDLRFELSRSFLRNQSLSMHTGRFLRSATSSDG
jgi:hypothetical protein